MSTSKKRRLPRANRPPSAPAALVTAAASAVSLPPALPSMFWQPLYLDGQQPYWIGHIPFAFWIIDAMKPSVLVELGTHTGNSYFAFCQAVERLATGTRCYAVDTWKGDAHTGEYGEDVFKRIDAHNSANYAAFSSLVRTSFDDALNFFSDDSIDLLHIDGCHEFDAVRHDFETWLPKLSNRSVVLLHDTNVRRPNFGVARFMDLLKEDYPTFQFHHSHGLGVVGVGGDISQAMLQLFESSRCEEAGTGLGRIFSRLGQACLDRAEKDRLSTDLSALHQTLQVTTQAQASERGLWAEESTRIRAEKSDLQSRQAGLQGERDQLAAQLAETQAAREELAARLAAAEAVRQESAARQGALAETTARLAAAEQELEQLRSNAARQSEELAALKNEREQLLSQIQKANAERDTQTGRLNEIEAARQELSARHTALQRSHDEMATRSAELDSLRHELIARQAVLDKVQAKLTTAEQALTEARSAREQAEADRNKQAEQNKLLLAQVRQLQEELEKYSLENRELKRSTDQLGIVNEAHRALTTLHQELADSHAQLVARHSSLESAQSSLIADRDSRLAERDAMAARLASLESDHSSLSTLRSSLAKKLDDLNARHSSLVTAMEELQGKHTSLATERDALEKSACEEKACFIEEVQKLTGELRDQSQRVRKLEELAAARLQDLAKLGAMVVQKVAAGEELETLAAYSGENNFHIKRIEVLDSHETPPHRHLNLVLHDVSLAGRDFARLPVRLLEHHGRVGLAFLRPPDLPDPPLQGWIESGRDGDQSFMLVIPADTNSQTFLQTACGSDQYFVRFLASTLEDALLNRYAHCPPDGWEAARVRKWLPVARALVRQLEQLPARLHYDRGVAAPGPQGGTWSFNLFNVFFAGRSLARLAWDWRPAAHGELGEIVLRLAEASAAPLLAWPHHDDHTPASEVAVKFESVSWGAPPRGANGSALEATDHAFLRSLVAELPVLVDKLAEEQGLAAKEQKQLLKLARRAAASQLHLST